MAGPVLAPVNERMTPTFGIQTAATTVVSTMKERKAFCNQYSSIGFNFAAYALSKNTCFSQISMTGKI